MQKYKKAYEIVTSATCGHTLTLTCQCKIFCYAVFKYPDQSFERLFNGLLPHHGQIYNTKFQNYNCRGKKEKHVQKHKGTPSLKKKTRNQHKTDAES